MGPLDKFDIIVRRRGETFIAGIPQIHLYGKGASILDAIERLEKKKRDLEAELTDADLDGLPTAEQKASGLELAGGLKLFAAKAGIVVGLIALAALVLGAAVSAKIADNARQLQHLGGHEFWARVDDQLSELADPKRGLSPDKQAQLLSEIREIGNRWRPFIVEIENIFREPVAPPIDHTQQH